MGDRGYEGIALWAGTRDGPVFHIREAVIPKQRGHRSDAGLSVMIAGEELHRINVALFENALSLIAQIHSHPGRAYHSEMDDTYPIVAKAGTLSLVVPDFAVAPFSLKACAVYRLSARGQWNALSPKATSELIEIVE